jgi:hypothetical protein
MFGPLYFNGSMFFFAMCTPQSGNGSVCVGPNGKSLDAFSCRHELPRDVDDGGLSSLSLSGLAIARVPRPVRGVNLGSIINFDALAGPNSSVCAHSSDDDVRKGVRVSFSSGESCGGSFASTFASPLDASDVVSNIDLECQVDAGIGRPELKSAGSCRLAVVWRALLQPLPHPTRLRPCMPRLYGSRFQHRRRQMRCRQALHFFS